MATKYILVGGYRAKAADGGKAFCEELVRDFTEPVKILVCLFARPRDTWEEVFPEDKEFFNTQLPGKKIELILADSSKFSEQVKKADVIYVRGGDTEQLVKTLGSIEGWREGLSGKTFAGSSAGADAIGKYYYGLDAQKVGEGLGLLAIKVIPHYRSNYNAPNIDWNKAYSELNNYQEDLPLVTLKEGEFKVITSD